MKKSVNGKSFDEIFAERGAQVQVEEMKIGEYYFTECPTFLIDWISIFDKIDEGKVWRIISIANSGNLYGNGSIGINEIGVIFTATPDQIALLNLYKSESK